MSTRRTFEVRRPVGPVLTFRTVDADEHSEESGVPALVYVPNNDAESFLTAAELEDLHQFTYELLAGRKGDPRLNRLGCGFPWFAGGERQECCLRDKHLQITQNVDHVTDYGLGHEIEPAF